MLASSVEFREPSYSHLMGVGPRVELLNLVPGPGVAKGGGGRIVVLG